MRGAACNGRPYRDRPRGIWLNEEPCQNGCRLSNRLKERVYGKVYHRLSSVTAVGLDLAKHVFQVHAVDASGRVVVAKAIRRNKLLEFFASLPPCLIGLEACGSAHHWARELIELGHDARMMPPAYVKPYIRRQKNDTADAAAICEAVTQPLDAICRRALA